MVRYNLAAQTILSEHMSRSRVIMLILTIIIDDRDLQTRTSN